MVVGSGKEKSIVAGSIVLKCSTNGVGELLERRTTSWALGRRQSRVVVAPVPVVGVHDHFGVGVAQRVDAAPVIGVALGDDDRAGRAGESSKACLAQRAFEDQAGVDDDPSVVGGEGVGVRHALGDIQMSSPSGSPAHPVAAARSAAPGRSR